MCDTNQLYIVKKDSDSARFRLARYLPGCLLLVTLLGLAACETTGGSVSELPQAPRQFAVLRAGDGIEIILRGIPDPSVNEAQIDDRGYVSLPYIGEVKAAGLTPSDLATAVRRSYLERDIYRSIDVSVRVTDRYVYVGGEVASPGRVIWSPDLTLLKAIQAAGGFSLYAREGGVQLSRDGETYRLDANRARREPGYDPPLYPGDSLNVPRSPF